MLLNQSKLLVSGGLTLRTLGKTSTRGQFHQKLIAGCDYFSVGDNFFSCELLNASVSL